MTPEKRACITPNSPLVDGRLYDFVAESNRIEGILRPPRAYEIASHDGLLRLDLMRVRDLEEFVREIAARPLRRSAGQNVIVGSHRPPPGGPAIESALEAILRNAHEGTATPYQTHVAYERLHPFLDGNGRSGRALWAWHMLRVGQSPFDLLFLHRFYYQALNELAERRAELD